MREVQFATKCMHSGNKRRPPLRSYSGKRSDWQCSLHPNRKCCHGNRDRFVEAEPRNLQSLVTAYTSRTHAAVCTPIYISLALWLTDALAHKYYITCIFIVEAHSLAAGCAHSPAFAPFAKLWLRCSHAHTHTQLLIWAQPECKAWNLCNHIWYCGQTVTGEMGNMWLKENAFDNYYKCVYILYN